MCDIYGGAIITAAGGDDDLGLQGVARPRKPQLHAHVRGRLLVSTLCRPEYVIESLKWATRVWTYQEAVLSTRRLVFTTDQVYFDYKGMTCSEAIDKPLSLLRRKKGKEGFRAKGRRGYFESYSGGTVGRNYGYKRSKIDELWTRIEEFSACELSHNSDSLNAFLEILKLYENCVPAVYHFWGLPTNYPGKTGTPHPFILILVWTHEMNKNETPPVRRTMFPSFEWIGWKEAATFPENRLYESFNSPLLFFYSTRCRVDAAWYAGGIKAMYSGFITHELLFFYDRLG
jgi:hypothetical protein